MTLLRHPDQISKLAGADSKSLAELASSLRALDLSAATPLPDGGAVTKPSLQDTKNRSPIRLWAAFTHSGPPAPITVPE